VTYYFLGERTLASFEAFVFPDLTGAVVVHDRYQNYVRHEAHCYIAC
jgi:transposase